MSDFDAATEQRREELARDRRLLAFYESGAAQVFEKLDGDRSNVTSQAITELKNNITRLEALIVDSTTAERGVIKVSRASQRR